jgi:hypothetical protein
MRQPRSFKNASLESIQSWFLVAHRSVTDLLPKLDAGTLYNGWIFGGRLRLYTEQIVEKIPMGFNSK